MKLKPGQMWFDVHGVVSGSNPTMYILVSKAEGGLWQTVSFYVSNHIRDIGWMGGQILQRHRVREIRKMKYVGDLQNPRDILEGRFRMILNIKNLPKHKFDMCFLLPEEE